MECTSADGTRIAFDRNGAGRPIILVDAALCYRQTGPNRALATHLANDFTVFSYDRRGRGESGDTSPYAVAREIEDVAAMVEAAGERPYLYGISSGGALALEAASRLGDRIAALALYEVPFVVDQTRPPVPEDLRDRVERLVASGRRAAAVRLFMREAARLPSVLVAATPLFPGSGKNNAVAHTIPYDLAVMCDRQRGEPLPRTRWSGVTVPTLVANGTKSPEWLRNATAQLAEVLPHAHHRVLNGQSHYVKGAALAPVLTEFITGASSNDTAATPHGAKGQARRFSSAA